MDTRKALGKETLGQAGSGLPALPTVLPPALLGPGGIGVHNLISPPFVVTHNCCWFSPGEVNVLLKNVRN